MNKKYFSILMIILLALLVAIYYLNNQKQANDIACGITNCHGLEVICGKDIAEFCTEEFQLGDNCREYVKCEKTSSGCIKNESIEFFKCKSCIEDCKNEFTKPEENIDLFECAGKCN